MVKALDRTRKNGLKRLRWSAPNAGRWPEIGQQVIVINDTHYARVEDAQISICHMLCYAFME